VPELPNSPEQVSSVFRQFDDVDFLLILGIAVASYLAIVTSRWCATWLTGRLPTRFRFYILPWIPLFRILFVLTAISQIVPLVIEPTASNLFAVFGAASVAIGFAFKDYVSSLIAGIVVLFERPYRVGDWVSIEGHYGEVRSLGMRTVNLMTPDDTMVTIPHNSMWSSAILNSNGGRRDMQCAPKFYVSPTHDGDHVRQKLLDVALTSTYLHIDHVPVVVAKQLPWATQYTVRAYPFECREQFAFITDLTLRGNAALRQIGIKLLVAPPSITQSTEL